MVSKLKPGKDLYVPTSKEFNPWQNFDARNFADVNNEEFKEL